MANRNAKRTSWKMNERAEVGIGTMIVFIATVLVAAIAAGVLIDTSGKLQERSSRTGNEATNQVSSNLDVQSIVGKRDDASNAGLQDLEIYLGLAPGADELDLAQLRIQVQNGTTLTTFEYDASTADADHFNASAVRDADSSYSSATPVMTSGDLVLVHLDLEAAGMQFEPRDSISILLVPELGAPVNAGFTTPNSFGTKTVVDLV